MAKAGVRVAMVGLDKDGRYSYVVQCTHPRCDKADYEHRAISNHVKPISGGVKAAADEEARWHRQWHTTNAARLAKEEKA